MRDAAAKILENTTIADIVAGGKGKKGKSGKSAAVVAKKRSSGG